MLVIPPEVLTSYAASWQQLASDLLDTIDRIEVMNRNAKVASINRAILVAVADDLQSLILHWCAPDGSLVGISDQVLRMCFPPLPTRTDIARDDEAAVPNASIDRAISKAAAEMLSWSTDPENFELLEQRRYWLFLQWPGEAPTPVNEYAYGLWDE